MSETIQHNELRHGNSSADRMFFQFRMFIPVSDKYMQHIWVIDKKEDGTIERKKSFGVQYVPLTDAPGR